MGCVFYDFVEIELLLLEHCLLAVEHTHLQHLLYQESESLRLVVNDATQMFLHLLALGDTLHGAGDLADQLESETE